MKVYLIDSKDTAIQLKQLLKLNAECAKLQWSTTIKDLSSNVVGALETIESFVEQQVYAVCTDENSVGALSASEESELMTLLRTCPELKTTFGTGVIAMGEEAQAVAIALEAKKITGVLATAIASGKNVVLF